METIACSPDPVEAENTSEQLPQAVLEPVSSTSDVLPAGFALVEEQQPHAISPVVGVLLEGIARNGQEEDALKKKAEQMFQDLGLGRGIDATRTKPWLDRTSFQVRPVRFDDLIGTAEGGSLETYESAALSSHSLQMKMQMEIAAPITNGTPPVSSKLQIGVDCEYERTVSNERHVFGRRVINRTISFINKFQDLPFLCQFAPSPQSVDARQLSFEDALAKWVLERLVHCKTGCMHPLPSTLVPEQPPSQALQDWLATEEHLSHKSLRLCIQKQCLQFVKSLHVTHYVSAIKLGAAEYAVMTESMYLHKLKASGTFGLEKLVSSKVAASKSSDTTNKMYKCRKLGIIEKRGGAAYVPRSSHQEAVINVEFQPIYQIVRQPLLRSILQEAVQQYIRDQEDPRNGPFYIASYGIINDNEEVVYLAVSSPDKEQKKKGMLDHTSLLLYGTTDKDSAAPFKIIPSDEGDGLNDFNIVYEVKNAYPTGDHQVSRSMSSQRTSNKLQSSAWYYLCTSITVWGTCSSPRLRLKSTEKDCLFVLRSPLKSSTKALPKDLDPWLSGQEEYFIHCRGGHRLRRNGYLAVQPEYKCETVTDGAKESEQTAPRFVTTCCPSRDAGEHHFMLFKLLPVDKTTSN